MKTSEIVNLSSAIAARVKLADLASAGPVVERRGSEVSTEPVDERHATVVIELDPELPGEDRVKGVRVRLAAPEPIRWEQLEDRFGPMGEESEYMDAADIPPTRVGFARPAGALPQTVRLQVNGDDQVVSYVVREAYEADE